MLKPRVSVCLPTYNKAHLLRSAIQSVLNQRFADFKLTILDDASTDGTSSVVAAFSDPRIQYIRHPRNIGLGANFNKSLEVADSQYVMIFHDDDVMLQDLLSTEVELMDAHPEVVFVHTAARLIDAESEVYSVPPQIWPPFTKGLDFVRRYWTGLQSGVVMASVMMRREVAIRIGGFNVDLKYSLDADLWQRMAFEGQVAFLNRILISNRIHGGQATSQIMATRLQMLEERLKHARASRTLLARHGANLDPEIDRQLSIKIATDLTDLRALDVPIRRTLEYGLAGVRVHHQVVRSFRFFVHLALAMLPAVSIRGLKKLHGKWFLRTNRTELEKRVRGLTCTRQSIGLARPRD